MRRPTLPANVPLTEILDSEAPLPSGLVADAPYFVPSGKSVSLAQGGLVFARNDAEPVRTWREARELRRRHVELMTQPVRYLTGVVNYALPADLRVPVDYLARPPAPEPCAVEGILVARQLPSPFDQSDVPAARALAVVAIGERHVEAREPHYGGRSYLQHISDVWVTDETALAELDARLARQRDAEACLRAWWGEVARIEDALAGLRPGEQPAGRIVRQALRLLLGGRIACPEPVAATVRPDGSITVEGEENPWWAHGWCYVASVEQLADFADRLASLEVAHAASHAWWLAQRPLGTVLAGLRGELSDEEG